MIGITLLCIMYVLCSCALLAYGIQCYVLTFLFLRKHREKLASQRKIMASFESITNEIDFPKVVTQLPMFNEKTVAVRAIHAAAAMEYPRSRHEIQVLDDSTDETRRYVDAAAAELRAKGVNVTVLRRADRTGYKAGALQNGLENTDAEFIAIFDADFVPKPDFLKRAIPFFLGRPKLGLVQGRWGHLNSRASLITRSQSMGIDGHFMVEQAARSWNGLFMNFNGTAGVFRRQAIESAGGWHHDTLTEDMDLSYRMQLKDWETEFVPDIEVPAEIPEDINAFKSQQFRWAKGSIQTAIKIAPLLLRKGISPFKLFQAIMHLTHYAVHPLMLMMALLSMPVLYFVKISLAPVLFGAVIFAMVVATSGPSTMYMVAQGALGNRGWKKYLLIPGMMLIGTGLAASNGKAVIEALLRKKSPFYRTPKKGEQRRVIYRSLRDFTPALEVLLGLYCLASVYLFLGYANFIVSPFLMLYSAGFLFVGALSIIHFRRPELIDFKLRTLAQRAASAL